ncbi:MAG: COX15/CtaA family protein, partial [Hyphomicrobiaceae bacterium]
PLLRAWLFVLAALIVVMVVVGGATRLTDSGLSITEWQPLLGAIPPLSDAAWQEAFEKYKQIPEYTIVNSGMSLAAFKGIYWWEWAHRFLGRAIGVVFLVPFLYFLARGRIPRRLTWPLAGIFALGGLQGAIGWYMVSSGLAERVDVSHYRLTLHLGTAVLIFAAIFWLALSLGQRPVDAGAPPARARRLTAAAIAGLVFLQILLGGLVAGLKAGLSHNTWPLMDGQFIPDGLGAMSPWYLNPFENVMTVQFDHRMLAYLVVVVVAVHVALMRRDGGAGQGTAMVLAGAVLAQVLLGIGTLVMHVPLHLALTHQAGAVGLFAAALWHAHDLSRAAGAATPTVPAHA